MKWNPEIKGKGFSLKLHRQEQTLYKREMVDYHAARDGRRNIHYPTTTELQEMYREAVLLDSHLRTCIDQRLQRVQNKSFVLMQADGTKADKKIQQLGQGVFLDDMIKFYLESLFYGYNLIWIKSYTNNTLDYEIIDRRNVIPNIHKIVSESYTHEGIDYRDYNESLLFCQADTDSYGLLESIVPLTILKRHSWVNWDDYEQRFGIPPIYAKVAGTDEKLYAKIGNWLKNLTKNSSSVLPEGTEIDSITTSTQNATGLFGDKIQMINKEISKLIVGQTMSLEDGSSLSQSQTHEHTAEGLAKTDVKKVIQWLNTSLLPALRYWGVQIPEGCYYDIEETVLPSERIKVDQELLRGGVRLSKDYIEKTYKVEVDNTPSDNQDLKKSEKDLLQLYADFVDE